MIKLCVGIENVAQLEQRIAGLLEQRRSDGSTAEQIHLTHSMPKRAPEIVGEGSLYWVIKGAIQARQRILDLRPATEGEGRKSCAIVLEPQIHRVRPVRQRAFQGWRYFKAENAPRDIGGDLSADLPAELIAELDSLGLL